MKGIAVLEEGKEMKLSDLIITKEDFLGQDWQRVIDECDNKLVNRYDAAFSKKASEACEAGDSKTQDLFAFLAVITCFTPDFNSPKDSFIPKFGFSDGSRTPLPSDFTDAQLNTLEEILDTVSDAEMRARIADILWFRRQDYRMANIAAKAYFESAKTLDETVHSAFVAQRIERAFRLAARIKNRKLISDIVAHIESVFDSDVNSELVSWSSQMMELLIEHKQGSPVKYAALAAKLARKCEGQKDWYFSAHFWDLQARWHIMNNDPDQERAAKIRAAETYVTEAERACRESYGVAAHHIKTAIQAYRRIGNSQERIEQLHALLLEYQQKAVGEMATMSFGIDLGDAPQIARDHVKGKSLQDAILSIGGVTASPSISDLRETVDEVAKISVVSNLMHHEIHNERGKTVAHKPPMSSEDESEREAAIQAELHRTAALQHVSQVFGLIEPAREQINSEHDTGLDLLWLVSDNPFIPPDHIGIYNRGLQAGMAGDFLVASHLLIPQLENSFRYILTQLGVIASGLDDNLIQDEYLLDKLLRDPKLIGFLGENMAFDFKGLLIDRAGGSNLRNLMSHGLVNDEGFTNQSVIYAWWLILRFCCLGYRIKQQFKNATATQESETSKTSADPEMGDPHIQAESSSPEDGESGNYA